MRLFFLLLLVYSFAIAEDKYLNVKGKLLCGEVPAFNILLRLWPVKEETGYDILAEGYTTQDGSFSIKGRVFSNKKHVFLKIYHDCADGMKPGQRKFVFSIPTKYADSQNNLKAYDFGELNLETRFKHNEEREEEVTFKRKRKDLFGSFKTTTPWSAKYEETDDRNDPW